MADRNSYGWGILGWFADLLYPLAYYGAGACAVAYHGSGLALGLIAIGLFLDLGAKACEELQSRRLR